MKKYYLIATLVALGWLLLFAFIGDSRNYFYVATSHMKATMSEKSKQEVKAGLEANGVSYTDDNFTIDIEKGRFWELEKKAGRYISFHDAGDEYIIESSKLYLATPKYISIIDEIPSEKRTSYEKSLLYKWESSPKDKRLIWLMLLPLAVVGFLAFVMISFNKGENLTEDDVRETSSMAYFSTFVMLLEIAMLVGGIILLGDGSASPFDILLFNKLSELGLGLLFAVVFIALAVANIALCLNVNKAVLKEAKLRFSWRSALAAVVVMMVAAIIATVVAMQLGIETKGNWTITIIGIAAGVIYWIYDTAKNTPQMFKILPLLILSTAIMLMFAAAVSIVMLIVVVLIAAMYYAPLMHKMAQGSDTPAIDNSKGICCTNCRFWNGSVCNVRQTRDGVDTSVGCSDFEYRS